jgi:hypothetical protein
MKQQTKAHQPEPYKADRSLWPSGPWDAEPDRLDFVHSGFACLLHRGPLGQWCGYVAVPETHPAFGKRYDDVKVKVHGGLTYADRCQGSICHVPQPGMPDNVWWLGFDCAHWGDVVPGMIRIPEIPEAGERYGTYKDLAYVRGETERLARQLSRAGKPPRIPRLRGGRTDQANN